MLHDAELLAILTLRPHLAAAITVHLPPTVRRCIRDALIVRLAALHYRLPRTAAAKQIARDLEQADGVAGELGVAIRKLRLVTGASLSWSTVWRVLDAQPAGDRFAEAGVSANWLDTTPLPARRRRMGVS